MFLHLRVSAKIFPASLRPGEKLLRGRSKWTVLSASWYVELVGRRPRRRYGSARRLLQYNCSI